MRKYFLIGSNKAVKAGLSSKIWKIERDGSRIQAWWGRARLDHLKKRIRRASKLRTKFWDFPTAKAATLEMKHRIDLKLRKGYQRTPRRRHKK